MMRRRAAILGMCVGCCWAAASRSVWDGVYTEDQAARGKTAYSAGCAKCHGEKLTGTETAPPLVGSAFLDDWKGRTAGDLLAIVAKTMPSDDPGTLSAAQYADITAYLLSANGFPAGDKELPVAAAESKDIRIEARK